MQFSWLASLTSLEELGFHGAGDDVRLPSELTKLTRLESLWLTMGDEPGDDMDFQVNWRDMRALRSISVDAGMYAFDNKLLQLMSVILFARFLSVILDHTVRRLQSFLLFL